MKTHSGYQSPIKKEHYRKDNMRIEQKIFSVKYIHTMSIKHRHKVFIEAEISICIVNLHPACKED